MSGGPPLPPKGGAPAASMYSYEGNGRHHPAYPQYHNRHPSGSAATASPAFSASSASASRSSDYSAGTQASNYYQQDQQWPAYTEPDAPPRPPRNSYWHRQVAELQEGSNDSQAGDTYAWASNDRPISSATGIISLYAGAEEGYRRGSDGSIESETSTRVPSRRTSSRPLPTLPQHHQQQQHHQAHVGMGLPSSSASAFQNGLSIPQLERGPHSRSVSPYAPVTHGSAPSPLPYSTDPSPGPHTLVTPPMPQMDDGYFGNSAATLSPTRNGGPLNEGPAWSPTASAFSSSSAQASPVANVFQPSLHRSQHSLGAMSALSSDSWASGDVEGSSRRAVPRLRVQSEAANPPPTIAARSSSSRKARAPLPPLPSRPSQAYADDDDLVTPTDRLAPFTAPGDHRPSSVMSHSSTIRPSYPRQDSWTTNADEGQREERQRQLGEQTGPLSRRTERLTRTTFVDFCQLSHLALLLRDAIPRESHVKGSISYPNSFTGKDLVSTIQELIPRGRVEAAAGLEGAGLDEAQKQLKIRQLVLGIARSLKSQLFFHEVDWGDSELQDGVDEVYLFLGDTMAQSESAERGPSGDFSFGQSNLDLSLSYDSSPRDHPVSSSGVDELPTGVIVQLTTCYSPSCGREGGIPGTACYSPSCPRSSRPLLQRTASATTPAVGLKTGIEAAGMPGAAGGVAHKAWAELVPPEVLASLPKAEITRQNAILEHIQKEEDFLADLQLLENLFIKGLEKPNANGDPPPIGIGPERDDFIREVFGNHRELVSHVKAFVEKLHIRQREESPIIRSIGDIFLDAALEWQEAFVTYVSAYPIAKSRIGREQSINPRFRDFLEACRREPACRRLGLDNFIHRALPHLQRHPLLLQTIIDKTDETNPDRESCVRAKEVIVQQCKTADVTIQEAQIKAKIRGFAYNLQTKRNKAVVDMDLLNPERQLMHEGRVYRRPDFTDLDWTEMQAVLFDNYFMVTKMKAKSDGGADDSAAFVLAKRPIPVEMLEMSGFNEPSVTFAIGLNALHLRSDRESRSLWPFTIHHLGGKLEPLTLFATSKQRRLEWRTKIEEAKGLRQSVVDANKAFDTVNLCESTFALPTALSGLDPDKAPSGVADASIFHGRVTCAVPFSMADRRKLMALGCADGVWIGLRNDPSSFRKVLHLKLVTQCAVLEEFGIFVVLADKVLISYSLEALVPTSTGGASQARPPQKLSGNRGVLFFGVGVLKDRTLLVYMKKKANESVFKALEPVVNQPSANSGGKGGNLFNKIKNDMSGKGADWFRMYKVFFIPSEAYSMQFLRNKLAVVCARGFEIMNLDTLLPGTIPDFSRSPRDDPRVLALARRVETSKPLGMFKLSGTDSDFLLCYDGFACYVDRSGEPIRLDNVIEWEGTPQSVAFCAPFVLAFDARFIEVREAFTGRLVQMIRSHDLRYVSSASIVEGSHAEHSIVCVQRTRPANQPGSAAGTPAQSASGVAASGPGPSHSLMNSYDVQNIFELLPTAPYAASQLARKGTTGTASTGLLSFSGTMSSSRSSRAGGGGGGSTSSKMRRYYEEGPMAGRVGSPVEQGQNGGGPYGYDGQEAPYPQRSHSSAANHQQQQYSQQQQRQQQQGFATRTILNDPPAPAGWI
ncbi:hypothetical protein BDZ90DRAFT_230285 [Jaminaea rosea]|uniref:CNH-domain-containing protein n=1 Tax=Jaminaea rosea TaxID=1569628 RepID=A0A316UVV5_9BASI|nr:hypothetical protein BDZ90DRAFT_230285 [Jaminaea rosea]PWN29409.1 hypothetical protein BDZ90DRAFT_230285 [Jaminaea rosea]